MRVSDLAEALDMSIASASALVDRMARRGLVSRRDDAEDRRTVLVGLAGRGRRPTLWGQHRAGLERHLADDDTRRAWRQRWRQVLGDAGIGDAVSPQQPPIDYLTAASTQP